jgi:hypothetical protein
MAGIAAIIRVMFVIAELQFRGELLVLSPTQVSRKQVKKPAKRVRSKQLIFAMQGVYSDSPLPSHKQLFHETHLAHCADRGRTRTGGIRWLRTLGSQTDFSAIRG